MKLLAHVVERPSAFDSPANYIGEREFPGWYCVLTRNRDSGVLAESNFRSALRGLGGESDTVAVHRFGHWACGWWEALAVLEGTPAYTQALALTEKLEDYPVVDEEDLSTLERETADTIWRDCYSVKERINYIREHGAEFEFRDYADMRGCVRGDYFAGYASELCE